MAFLNNASYTLKRQSGNVVGALAWVTGEAEIEARGSSNVPVRLRTTETLVLRRVADDQRELDRHARINSGVRTAW